VRYLLDTDHISLLQRPSTQESKRILVRLSQYSPTDFALSIVSFHEQVLGAHNFINRARTNSEIIRGYTLLCVNRKLQGCMDARRTFGLATFFVNGINLLRQLLILLAISRASHISSIG
jgi:hypothetical protein